jgi:hypothetical protein
MPSDSAMCVSASMIPVMFVFLVFSTSGLALVIRDCQWWRRQRTTVEKFARSDIDSGSRRALYDRESREKTTLGGRS